MIKKFLIVFLPASMLLGAVFLLFYLSNVKSRERLIASELKAQVSIQSNTIFHHFENVVSDLAILSELHELRQMADNIEDFSPKELEDDFLSISLRKGLYDQIRFIKEDGQEVLRVDYNNGRPLLVPKTQLKNKANRYYFKGVMALAREETYISPLDLNIEKGEVEKPFKPVIRFGTPILNSKGEKRGILLLNFLAKPTLEEFKNKKHLLLGQQDSLLNSEGYWLAGPKTENEWGFMLRERKGKTFSAAHPGSWERVLSKDTGQFQTSEGLFTFTTLYPLLAARDSKDFSEKTYRISLPDTETFFWKIVSFVSQEEFNNAAHEKSRPLRNRLVKFYSAVLLITGFGVFFLVSVREKRKYAEEALNVSEQKFRTIMQSATDAIISADSKGQIVTWNSAAETIFGYSEDEALSQPITILIPERYKEEHRRAFELANFTGELKKPGEIIEAEGVRKDGSEFPLEHSLSCWRMGGELFITSIIRDTTKRKQAEKELESRRTEVESIGKELLQFIETANAPIFGIDRKGTLNEWNQTTERITGYLKDDVLGKNFVENFISDDFKKPVREILENALKGIETANYELTLFTKDGKKLLVLLNASTRRDVTGKIIGVIGVGQDITELDSYRSNLEDMVEKKTVEVRKSLADTEKARDRIDTILKSVADGLIVTDINNRVVLMNQAAEKLLNIRFRQVVGRPFAYPIEDSTLSDKIVEALNKKTVRYEFNFKLSTDDPKKPVIMRGITSVILNKAGKQTGIVTLIHDITQERKIDKMKTEFISTAAHELRTPLTSIQGFSEILLTRDNLTPEEKNKFTGYINKQAVGLGKIINDLLDISRIESGKDFILNKVYCSAGEAIKQIVPYFEEKSDLHEFKVKLPDKDVSLYVDKEKMGQVLKNIISNAIKYSPKGGVIKIHSAIINNEYRISVEDEGIGMTPDQLKQVFDKFYRADASDTAIEGTGLGMSIVKYIVEAHEGKIEVESNFGKGTKVCFTLPITNAQGEKQF